MARRREARRRQARRRTKTRRKPVRTMRWLVLGVVLLIGFLYYRPLSTYVDRKNELARRQSEVRSLEQERRALQRRVADSQRPEFIARKARRLGLIRPGEKLFIVSGIAEWNRAESPR